MTKQKRIATTGQRRFGLPLLACGLLALCALDAAVLGVTTGYFGGGYNSPRLSLTSDRLAFLAGGALLDSFLLTAGYAVAFALGWVIRLTGLARIAFAGGLALLVPLTMDVVSHQLHRVFGKVLGLDLLVELAGGRFSDAALVAVSEAPVAALGLVAAALAVLAAIALARRLETRLAPTQILAPRTTRLALLCACAAGGGALVLHLAGERWPVIAYGLDRKPSGMALRALVQSASDFDRDGYGFLSRPPDPAPFDAAIHPFAVEIPGNGIDENGVGGDLPRDWKPAALPSAAAGSGASRPPFLLIFLESFRGDLVGRRLGGRAVAPHLEAVAAGGASSARAYAHNPFTWVSRAQLFQGRLRPRVGAPTLIDDFKARGYRVAYVSGQDDSHGGEGLVGFERADFFVDARTNAARKTSRTALTVSLQVSWRLVLEEVERYLAATREDGRPLFLYVNLVDTHFPYHHDELEPLLGVEPVGRPDIRPWNAERVFASYLQAAANVDRAIGALLGLWRAHVGDAPLLVTADHGQAFYEEGMLGHGQSMDEIQSRVPLIVHGIGGEWPEPLGVADLRGLILSHLFEGPGRVRFAPDPRRQLFQFLGLLERPNQIALRSTSALAVVDLHTRRARRERSAGTVDALPNDSEAAREIIWTWESLVAGRAEADVE